MAVANNKRDIIKDWEWIESNLMQTLGMFSLFLSNCNLYGPGTILWKRHVHMLTVITQVTYFINYLHVAWTTVCYFTKRLKNMSEFIINEKLNTKLNISLNYIIRF